MPVILLILTLLFSALSVSAGPVDYDEADFLWTSNGGTSFTLRCGLQSGSTNYVYGQFTTALTMPVKTIVPQPGTYFCGVYATQDSVDSPFSNEVNFLAIRPQLMVSVTPDRANALPLSGSTAVGSIYAFLEHVDGLTGVQFFLDDPVMALPTVRVESLTPYDFGGTNATNIAIAEPYDTKLVPNGPHNITAAMIRADGTTKAVSATFTVSNAPTPPPPPPADTIAPTVTFGTITVRPNKTRLVPVTASDAGLLTLVEIKVNSTVERRWLTSTTEPPRSSFSYTVSISKQRLGAGAVVTVTARDAAGNTTTTTKTITR